MLFLDQEWQAFSPGPFLWILRTRESPISPGQGMHVISRQNNSHALQFRSKHFECRQCVRKQAQSGCPCISISYSMSLTWSIFLFVSQSLHEYKALFFFSFFSWSLTWFIHKSPTVNLPPRFWFVIYHSKCHFLKTCIFCFLVYCWFSILWLCSCIISPPAGSCGVG